MKRSIASMVERGTIPCQPPTVDGIETLPAPKGGTYERTTQVYLLDKETSIIVAACPPADVPILF